jgi:hypothetical protein
MTRIIDSSMKRGNEHKNAKIMGFLNFHEKRFIISETRKRKLSGCTY